MKNSVAGNYIAVLEQGPQNWSAYVPDLPGCVAVGVTREETEHLIQEAIEFHVEGLLLDGTPLPVPKFDAEERLRKTTSHTNSRSLERTIE